MPSALRGEGCGWGPVYLLKTLDAKASFGHEVIGGSPTVVSLTIQLRSSLLFASTSPDDNLLHRPSRLSEPLTHARARLKFLLSTSMQLFLGSIWGLSE